MKNYITIMKEALANDIKDHKKPDLSVKDWSFILECLVALENIYKDLSDDVNADHFIEKCKINFEVLGDITGHEIL